MLNILAYNFGNAKVYNLQLTFFVNADVGWLYVPVTNILGMNLSQSGHKLINVLLICFFGQVFHYDANLSLVYESVYESDNRITALQMLKNHEFSEGVELDAVPIVEGVLFTHLNRDILTRLNLLTFNTTENIVFWK